MSQISNVKLNWKFDKETKALRADGPGETWYSVSNYSPQFWRCSRMDSHRASWLNGAIPSLEEALALCQRDAEEQKKRKIDAAIAEGEKAPLKDAQLEAKFVELEQRLIGGFDALVDKTVKWQDQNVAARRPVNQELGELRARVQELEAASCVYEGSLAFHDERLEKLEAK